ncbi:hypothetical protein [Kordia zhangzhouensis]|uniref:hypothetical protein n=1 Tax=Kordia zhangzhouensis TaxID=1620405 RepID=UPI0012FCE32C|nr:hypothetical protein [Kordia zhangzhouensis]
MKKSNNRNQNNKSLHLQKNVVSRLNQKTITGGIVASNISANLTQCLSDATYCHACKEQ